MYKSFSIYIARVGVFSVVFWVIIQLLLIVIAPATTYGAISDSSVFEVRATGSDTNAGFFVTGSSGTDYSQQDSCQATGTATSATTTVTATTGIFTSAMVGNGITDGTTWRQITAFTSSTVVTVDAAPSWTAASVCVGGGLLSPGKAASIMPGQSLMYVKYSASVYSITTATTNVSNGFIVLPTGTTRLTRMIGYNTTHGDNPTGASCPVLQVSGVTSSGTVITGTSSLVSNIILDGNSLSTLTGAGFNFLTYAVNIKVENFPSAIGVSTSVNVCSQCEAQNCGQGLRATVVINSVAHGCGVGIRALSLAQTSIAYANTSTGIAGNAINCTSYGNGSQGFGGGSLYFGCLAVGNTGTGFPSTSSSVDIFTYNSASYNNTGGTGLPAASNQQNTVTLTANPFTNAGSGDFSLNNTAGGGAALRAAGYPGVFPDGLTTGYLDIGAVQHQDSGGGTTYIFPIFK